MGKMLVLMRHGKAQSRDLDIPDDERTLTRAGAWTLAARLPHGVRLWGKHAATAVWTSPAIRCRQTAEALIKTLRTTGKNISDAEDRAFLRDQDIEAFLTAIAAAPTECVVCVGHNPFIEEATTLLSGAQLHFRPGGFAAFELPDAAAYGAPVAANMASFGEHASADDSKADGSSGAEAASAADAAEGAQTVANTVGGNESTAEKPHDSNALGTKGTTTVWATDTANLVASAELLWFVQGTPVDNWNTLCELEEIVQTAHRRMNERLAAFLANPDDVETLHKLRVSIRTLRSILKFLTPFLPKAQANALQRNLRAIVAPTSRLRELDVLASEALSMEPPSDELADACALLRDEERDRVMAALTGPEAQKALTAVADAVAHFTWRRRVWRNGLPRKAVAQRFERMEAVVRGRIAALDMSDAEKTHDVRKLAKRMRYSAENFAAFLDPNQAAAASERMKAVQDDLGALCDARVNVEIVDEFPRKGLSDQALRDLDALEAQSRFFVATKLRSVSATSK